MFKGKERIVLEDGSLAFISKGDSRKSVGYLLKSLVDNKKTFISVHSNGDCTIDIFEGIHKEPISRRVYVEGTCVPSKYVGFYSKLVTLYDKTFCVMS